MFWAEREHRVIAELEMNKRSVLMWKANLKDGKEVTLRFLKANDGNELFQMFSSMSDGALEWSMAPYTMDVIQRWISNIQNLIPLVAEYGKKVVGYAVIYRFPAPRRKGIGDFAIYLHQDFHNVGLGTAMTERVLQLAKAERMHKIELSVVAENKNAIHLYKNLGFQIEGVTKDSFYGRDGKYHDLVHMGIIFKT
jgi:RimJ/RimL family protein N-acetyltransferase